MSERRTRYGYPYHRDIHIIWIPLKYAYYVDIPIREDAGVEAGVEVREGDQRGSQEELEREGGFNTTQQTCNTMQLSINIYHHIRPYKHVLLINNVSLNVT